MQDLHALVARLCFPLEFTGLNRIGLAAKLRVLECIVPVMLGLESRGIA